MRYLVERLKRTPRNNSDPVWPRLNGGFQSQVQSDCRTRASVRCADRLPVPQTATILRGELTHQFAIAARPRRSTPLFGKIAEA